VSPCSASRFERPTVSSSTSRECARRFASVHSCWKRGDAVNSFKRERICDCTPVAIAGASTSARSGSTSRASWSKSIFELIAVSSLAATARCTAGWAAIGATVLT
jgi:hypothetical protein